MLARCGLFATSLMAIGCGAPEDGTPVFVIDPCDGVDEDMDGVVDEDAACRPVTGEASAMCVEGECVGTCEAGRVRCEDTGSCVVPSTFEHCDGCSPCAAGQLCAGGTCVEVASLTVRGNSSTQLSDVSIHPAGWVVGGSFESGATVGPATSTSRGMFVALLDATATPTWTTFGTVPVETNSGAHVAAVTVVGTDVFVTGASRGTPFALGTMSKTGLANQRSTAYLSRLTATGTTEWLSGIAVPESPIDFSSGTSVVPYGSGIAVSANYARLVVGGTSATSIVNTVSLTGDQSDENWIGGFSATVGSLAPSGSSLWAAGRFGGRLNHGGVEFTAFDADRSFVVQMAGDPLVDGTTAEVFGSVGVRAIESDGSGGYFAWLSSGHIVSKAGTTERWRIAVDGISTGRFATLNGRLFVAMEGNEALTLGTVAFEARATDRIILAELDPDDGAVLSSTTLDLGGTLALRDFAPAENGESFLLLGNPSGTVAAANVMMSPAQFRGVAVVVPADVLP